MPVPREHPELAETLCVEVLTRQLGGDGAMPSPQALLCVCPWLELLSFSSRWEGTWSEAVLRALLTITRTQGGRHPVQVGRGLLAQIRLPRVRAPRVAAVTMSCALG